MEPNQANDQGTTTAPALPELWDEQRLADYLGVGLRFVRRLCEEGRIRFILVARHRRFDPADVAAYIEAEKRGPDGDQAPVPRFSPATKRRPGRPIGSGRFGNTRTGIR
jgi:excisionase family DNA binding protein